MRGTKKSYTKVEVQVGCIQIVPIREVPLYHSRYKQVQAGYNWYAGMESTLEGRVGGVKFALPQPIQRRRGDKGGAAWRWQKRLQPILPSW